MQRALVSVVCTAYNRADRLVETIQHLRTDIGVPYELFICDNSPHLLELGTDLLPYEHHELMDGNHGTAARAHGISRATAPFLLMLDDDSSPFPGAMEAAIAALGAKSDNVAGLIAHVTHPDRSTESSLLPTVFLGCGVLFRTEAIQQVNGAYPRNFVFYGEEYWQTLVLYAHGWQLDYCPELRIQHRADKSQGNKERIFYYLARNNHVIWERFTPAKYLEQVLYDTNRRYELIAAKEGVRPAHDRGCAEALGLDDEPLEHELSDEQFHRFARLDYFDSLDLNAKKVVLCGTGKFPSLWADYVLERGADEVLILDRNPGLIGHNFGLHRVHDADLLDDLLQDSYVPITGHSSIAEQRHWQDQY